jgi:predicted aconitase with swiveling domain
MANVKISELTSATTPLAGTEVFPLVQSSTTKKATVADVLNSANATFTPDAVVFTNASRVLTTNAVLTYDGTDFSAPSVFFTGDYTETVYTITDGAAVNINPANGTVQLWTLGANRSPTATGFASGESITLMVNDGSAYTITWPSVEWKTNGGVAPTLNTTGYTVIQLWKVSTTLYGARVGDA